MTSGSEIRALRKGIVLSLQKQGFIYERGKISLPEQIDKEGIRQLHQEAVRIRLEKSKKGLLRWEPKLLSYIAEGREIIPDKISPRLVQVEPDTENELLFRYASLHWSIPVSSGYGRRLRFLVFDYSNGKLIGLLGLGDPVFSLAARDEWVGWNKGQQKNNLKHVMDAFVLGSIPPYSQLLCGKLVAMLLASNEVRETFKKKYQGQRSLIKRKVTDGRLVLITTTSALGRSSIYNRISYNGRHLFKHVGYTSGSGEFHFSNGLYAELARFASLHCEPTAKQKRWGIGFRNRREIVRKVLPLLGLPSDLMYHQIKREVFAIPLAKNAREFLRGQHERVQWFDTPAKAIFEYFKDRWMLGRAERNPNYLSFRPSSYALWTREGRILYDH
ncbi:MAG TPA: Druantia anti-phage system protein DruA [Syntrophales bacterium]|nr:Druantia anti-phage system protein DruA [Syntrophales bacterium]